jgi:hypothetical protein
MARKFGANTDGRRDLDRYCSSMKKRIAQWVLAIAFLFGACWATSWVGWYMAGFSAPNLPQAAARILQKYSYTVGPEFSLKEEGVDSDDPSIHKVYYYGPDGSARYRMEIKSMTSSRWVECKFEKL